MKLTYHPKFLGATIQINLATIGAVVLLIAHLAVDIQAKNVSAVIADVVAIAAALGLPAVLPTPPAPAPAPVPTPPSMRRAA